MIVRYRTRLTVLLILLYMAVPLNSARQFYKNVMNLNDRHENSDEFPWMLLWGIQDFLVREWR